MSLLTESSQPGVPPPEILMQLPFLNNRTRDELLAMTSDELQALIDDNTPAVPRINCYQCEGTACINQTSINAVLCDEGVTTCMNVTQTAGGTNDTAVKFMLDCATWSNLNDYSGLPGTMSVPPYRLGAVQK